MWAQRPAVFPEREGARMGQRLDRPGMGFTPKKKFAWKSALFALASLATLALTAGARYKPHSIHRNAPTPSVYAVYAMPEAPPSSCRRGLGVVVSLRHFTPKRSAFRAGLS
jgi:hypothetical protein